MSLLGLYLILGVGVLTLLTGLPAYVVLLMASVTGAVVGVLSGAFGLDVLRSIGTRLVGLLESDLLQALPLFLLMGALLNRLPVTDSLFKCGHALFRRLQGAPLISGFLLGALIGPMNGSVGASVGALSRTLGPRMAAAGVAAPQRTAVIAVAGTLGVVVPPSLVLILLGDAMLSAHTIAVDATKRADRVINTQDLMRGALLPAGIFLLLCLLMSARAARSTSNAPPSPSARSMTPTWREIGISLVSVVFLVMLLGGVATGRFYAVEAAAVGAVALFIAALAGGQVAGRSLIDMLDEVMVGTGTLFAPLIAATTFTLVLRVLGTDKMIEAWIATLPGGPQVAIIVILSCLAVLAVALDAFEIIFVAVPILVPALLMRVEDAVWVGVLVLLVLQTSFLLPPMGYAWVLSRAISDDKVAATSMLGAMLPFLIGQIAVLAVIVAVPSLVHVLDPPGSRQRASSPDTPAIDAGDVLRNMPALGIPGVPAFGTLPAIK